jgi:hypothetical protein
MKRLLLLLTMVLAFNISNAQCDLTVKTDDFTQSVTKYTSMRSNPFFYKVDETTYLNLTSYSVSLMNCDPTVSILFEDGTIMKFDSKVVYHTPSRGSSLWSYTTLLNVTPELATKLQESDISKWKLYIFEAKVYPTKVSTIELYKCISE